MAAPKTSKKVTRTAIRLELPGRLDLKASEALVGDLRAARGASLAIDAAAVEHLGAHALQTLIVAASSWHTDGHEFRVENLTAEINAQLVTLGADAAVFGGEGGMA